MKTLPTDYSHQQLVDALFKEYDNLCHDSTLEDGEFTPAEYLVYLQSLTHAQLVEETATDDENPLSDFMSTYGWCLPLAICEELVSRSWLDVDFTSTYSPLFHIHMFTYQSSSFISYIRTDVLRGTCDVQLKDGKFYTYYNVSRRALLNLEFNKSMSLGFWFNRNCVNSDATSSLVFDVNKVYAFQSNPYVLSAAW